MFMLYYKSMTMKKKILSFVSFSLLFIIIYVCLAVLPMGQELQISPNWTINLNSNLSLLEKDSSEVFLLKNPEIANSENTKNIPFKLGQNFGYFTEDGKILSFQTFPFKATISQDLFATFSSNSQKHTIYKADGTEVCKIQSPGFPFVQDDRIYVFAPGGSTVSSFKDNGDLNWRYEAYAPIVSFRSSENAVVIGYVDGNIRHFYKDEKTPTTFFPGGSNYPVILGNDVSCSGELVACVSGIDKQRFVLYRILDGQSKVIYHEYLQSNKTEQVFVNFVDFLPDSQAIVFYQHGNGLGIFSMEDMKSHNIDIKGKIISVAMLPEKRSIFLLSKISENEYALGFVNNHYKLVGLVKFQAKNAFLVGHEDSLYIGKDDSISRFDLMIK